MGNRNVEKPYKLNENTVSQKSILLVQNPYKTCLKLMIFEPKSQKDLQNDQKSIRFIDKTHMAFRHVAKPYKPCRLLILLGPFLQNGIKKCQKALGFPLKVDVVLRLGKISKTVSNSSF